MAQADEERRLSKFGAWLSYWLAAIVLIPVGLIAMALALWIVWLPPDPPGDGVDRRTTAFVIALLSAGMLMTVLGAFSTRVENFAIGLKGLKARLRRDRRLARAKQLQDTDAPATAQEARIRAATQQDAQRLDAARALRAAKKKQKE